MPKWVANHKFKLLLAVNLLALPGLLLFIWSAILGVECAKMNPGNVSGGCGDAGFVFFAPQFLIPILFAYLVGFIDLLAAMIWFGRRFISKPSTQLILSIVSIGLIAILVTVKLLHLG